MLIFLINLTCAHCILARYFHFADIYVQSENSLDVFPSGQFIQNISSGCATYNFYANLTNVTTCDFDRYPQVSFHIHTKSIFNWRKAGKRSCYHTGGQYDPNLACSESSESHQTLCPAINRTFAQGYHYTCVGSQYEYAYANPDGKCAVGDISGKLRLLTVPATRYIQFIRPFTDVLPVYVRNFNASTPGITHGWRSFVLQCGDPGHTPIACGDFRAARPRDPLNTPVPPTPYRMYHPSPH